MKIIFGLLLFILPGSLFCQNNISRTDSIRNSLLYQKRNYPSSQYRDVYKNFMQDFYGPGHLINNKMVACDNLKKELNSTAIFDGPDFEPTGYKGNFYRVNLRLIAYGKIPYETFLNAFVESVQSIVPPEPSFWMNTWEEIDNVIRDMDWHFNNEENDRKNLKEQFEKEDFVVHHSDSYNENVNFHYRIISKENFQKKILPYLEDK